MTKHGFFKNKRITKFTAVLLVVAIVVGFFSGIITGNREVSAAGYNEDDYVTFGEYQEKYNIPAGTKLVGMYLIDIRATNDVIYDMAMESAAQSSQSTVFYKSELGDNQWYDITTAGGVSEITSEGTLADMEELNNRRVLYHITGDGITYRIKREKQRHVRYERYLWIIPRAYVYYTEYITRVSTSVFLDPDFYSMWKMSQFGLLADLRENYTTEYTNGNDILDYYRHVIYNYLSLADGYRYTGWGPWGWLAGVYPLRYNTSRKYDATLSYLNFDYKRFMATGNSDDEEIAAVMYDVMASVYAEKQVMYYRGLVDITNERLMSYFTNPRKYQWTYKGVQLYPDTLIISTLGDSLSSLTKDAEAAERSVVTDPGDKATELEKARYKEFAILRADGATTPMSVLRPAAQNYSDYTHILEGSIANKDRELYKTIMLLMDISPKFVKAVNGLTNDNYKQLKASDASTEVLDAALAEQLLDAEAVRSELEFMIDAKTFRSTRADAKDYITKRILWTENLYGRIADEEFASNSKLVIAEHIEWLSRKLKQIINDEYYVDGSKTSSIKTLEEKKNALMEDVLKAYESNDLEESERLMSEILELDSEIEELEEELFMSSDSDPIADAELSESATLKGLISRLRSKTITDMEDGLTESGALKSLVSIGADDVINELSELFAGNYNFERALTDAINEFNRTATAEDKVNKLAAENGGGGEGSNTGGINGDSSLSGGNNANNEGGNQNTTGNGDTSGNGTGQTDDSGNDGVSRPDGTIGQIKNDLSDPEIKIVIDNILGDVSLDAEGKLIAAVVTGKLADEGYESFRPFSRRFIGECVAENNKYVYKTRGEDYVSLATVSRVTKYRYVYEDNLKVATMEHLTRGNAYVFSVDKNEVSVDGINTVYMPDIAKYTEDGMYIPSESSRIYFDIKAEPVTEQVSGISYSGGFTGKMEAKAKDLYDAFKYAMGE